jgi:hypothetical protein
MSGAEDCGFCNGTSVLSCNASGQAPRRLFCVVQRATLLRIPDACAHGILMELTHAEIEQVYSEASVRAYRPEAVLAELTDGSRVPALCFNLPVPPGPEEADSEYAAKLRDLARRLGLPSDYVESIQ